MPASSKAIRAERILDDDGRTLDFRVSVSPGGAVSAPKMVGHTDSPLGGWVSVWEHLVLQVGSLMADGLFPAGVPAHVDWTPPPPTGGIRVDFRVRLPPDAGLAGIQPLYEQFALVAEQLQHKVARRDAGRMCTGAHPEPPPAR
jgi:hypothetical protein